MNTPEDVSVDAEGADIPTIPSLDELNEDSIQEIVSNPEISDFLEEVTSPAPESSGFASDDTDVLSSSFDDSNDEVSDDELMQILNDATEAQYQQYAPPQATYTEEDNIKLAQEMTSDDNEDDYDFDIDSKLAQVSNESAILDEHDEELEQRIPDAPKEKRKGSIIVPALVFAILVVVCFLGFKYISGYIAEMQFEKEKAAQATAENAEDSVPVHDDSTLDELKPEEETTEDMAVILTGRDDPFVPLEKYKKVAASAQQNQDQLSKLAALEDEEDIPAPVAPKKVGISPSDVVNNLNYGSAKVPKPPKYYGELNEVTTKLMSIIVSGIMYDETKPSAIINLDSNDYFVQKGDRLDNFKVVDIGRDYVKIALGKNVYKAKIGEEFKINEFYGNSPYYTDRASKGRQYWSSEDEFKERFTNQAKYMSDSDVPIYVK